MPDLKVAEILRDGGVLEQGRQEAFVLAEKDPDLKQPGHEQLKAELMTRWGGWGESGEREQVIVVRV